MDEYTAATKRWLEQRFRRTDEAGVFRGHQPIYGFRQPPCERASIRRYTITYHILRELAGLDFDSFLDVGGAEGYKAALVRQRFGVQAVSSDLSEEACRRAREIYGLEARPMEIHALPFDDDSFDVVLCSETLEHVRGFDRAVRELLRVARSAVVITVPHEPVRTVARNLRENVPHGHIHALDVRSLEFLRCEVAALRTRRILSPWLRIPAILAEANAPNAPTTPVARAYAALCPLLERGFGRRTAAALMRADRWASWLPGYHGFVCTLVKRPECVRARPRLAITPRDVIDFAVPPHHLPADVQQPDEPRVLSLAGS